MVAPHILVTKLDAASRQLDAAIQLLFSGGDSIAVHALAVAAANVFADVAEHKNAGASWRAHMCEDSGLSIKQLKTILHKAWNFFKHADHDPDVTLTFNEIESEDIIFMAVLDCGDLQPTSCAMQAFQTWYIAAHPNQFPTTMSEFAETQQALPYVAGLAHPQQIQAGAHFFRQHCAQPE